MNIRITVDIEEATDLAIQDSHTSGVNEEVHIYANEDIHRISSLDGEAEDFVTD